MKSPLVVLAVLASVTSGGASASAQEQPPPLPPIASPPVAPPLFVPAPSAPPALLPPPPPASPAPVLAPVPAPVPSAAIPAPGQVVVTMHEDAALRGTVVEVSQGGHPAVVTVVPWRSVGPEAPPAVAVAPIAPPPAQPAPASPTRGAWVHLDADSSVVLEAVAPNETNWKPVCRGPCDLELSTESLYRVTAPDMETSKPFSLASGPGGRVSLDLHPTSKGSHDLGWGLLIGGGVGLTASFFVFYADAIASVASESCFNNNSCGAPPALTWTGVGLAVAGAASLILGIVELQPTTVSQVPSWGPPSRQGAGLRDDRWRRTALWREASPADAAIPKATSIPIFSTTF